MREIYSLLALVIWLGSVLQEASIFNGNLVANVGNGAIALLEDGLGNTHDC